MGKPALKNVVSHLVALETAELAELLDVVQALIEVRERQAQDLQEQGTEEQDQDPVKPGSAKQGGYLEQKTIRGYGPYTYLRYRHRGKLKSIYIGKSREEAEGS